MQADTQVENLCYGGQRGAARASELFQRLPRTTTDEVATGRGEDAGRGRILASARQLVPPGATGAMLSARSPNGPLRQPLHADVAVVDFAAGVVGLQGEGAFR